MNFYYPKYTKNDGYQTRYNRNKGNYYQRKNRYQNHNNYKQNNYYKKINYENNIYEEEINNDKEISEGSFSKSTHSNSRKNSFGENNNENNEVNQESSTPNISNDNNKEIVHEQNNNIANKIKISQDVIKSAFFIPKSYKEKNNIIKPENNFAQKEKIEIKEKKEKKDENIVILEINIRISKDKTIFFELRKYDDMFLVIKKFCEENNLNEKIQKFLPLVIIKALNSIYGIMNLKLTNEEIVYIKEIREKYL
jgi:hypothetical protein